MLVLRRFDDHRPHLTSRGAQQAFGLFLTFHAVAHLAGSAAAVEALRGDGAVDVLGGLWVLDADAALWAWAAVWALVAAGFVGSALLLAVGDDRWLPATIAVAAASAVMCIIGLGATAIGLLVDLAILVALIRPPAHGALR